MFRISNTSVFLVALVLSLTQVWTCNATTISNGKALFNENCAACHQKDAIGKPGLAPSLSNPTFQSVASDKFLYQTISKGREGTAMGAWDEELGEEKIKAVIAYLRSFSKGPNRSAEVDAQRHSMGNAKLGKIWYRGICAKCHGRYGQGYSADGSGTAIGGPSFLSVASDGFIRETIKFGRPNTRMRPFSGPDGLANLNDSEIDDVIKYMRTLRIP